MKRLGLDANSIFLPTKIYWKLFRFPKKAISSSMVTLRVDYLSSRISLYPTEMKTTEWMLARIGMLSRMLQGWVQFEGSVSGVVAFNFETHQSEGVWSGIELTFKGSIPAHLITGCFDWVQLNDLICYCLIQFNGFSTPHSSWFSWLTGYLSGTESTVSALPVCV